jgi:hypothetical protein
MAGILIAGSLYWSDKPHRVRWRRDHVKPGSEVSVAVPIRYGRLSSTGSYTMVFAPGSPLGKAKILECIRAVKTFDHLVAEAQALWLAESPHGSPRRARETLSSDWGCVALLANPSSTLPAGLLDAWAARVAKERHDGTTARSYNHSKYFVKGASAITDRGTLEIAWPVRSDTGEAISSIDLLLATATKPTPVQCTGDYPTAERIAAAWIATQNDQYFRENRINGFYTFQDEEIAKHLDRRERSD